MKLKQLFTIFITLLLLMGCFTPKDEDEEVVATDTTQAAAPSTF